MKLEERAKEKEQEIFEIIKNTITPYSPDPEQLSKKIMDLLCEITPPEKDDSILGFIIMDQRKQNGAESLKPGNIFLNWKKLLTDDDKIISSISIDILLHKTHPPWLIVIVGLEVYKKVLSLSRIEIGERSAAVLWTMWKNKDKENCIEKDKMLDLVNKELFEYDRPMNKKELDKILEDLEKIRCIENTKENKWKLKEKIKIKYQ